MYKLQYSDSSKSAWLIGDKLGVVSASSNGVAVSGSGIAEYYADVLISGDKISFEKFKFIPKAATNMNTAEDEDDVGKTIVASVIDSGAIKKAQAELVKRKHL